MLTSILVTGSSGFLGKALCKTLRDRNIQVLEYDIVNGDDILDRNKLKTFLSKVQAVVHLAAPSSSLMFFENPKKSMYIALQGFKNIIEQWSGLLVFPSTCTLYGSSIEPVRENSKLPITPNLYADSKKRCEELCAESTKYGMRPVILRIFSGYGPGELSKGKYASPLFKFVACSVSGIEPVIYDNGMQVRDFIYVDDIVEAIIGGLAFKGSDLVCNIGTGIGTSFLKLMTLIESELGIEIRPLKRTAPVGYVPSIVADISVAAREIGFCPKFTINEGIALTLKTVLTNGTVAKLKGGLQDWIN